MQPIRNWRSILVSDLGILILLALGRILFQVFTNAQYGFFRDELVTLDDARHLAWGFVTYPPVTPFLGRVGLELFGISLNGIRLFSVIVQGIILLIVGLMIRAMGGKRWAQIIGALAVALSPTSIINGTVLQYVTFDYFCWVLIAYFVIRLLASDNPRWWIGIGIAVGFAVLTKYTAFLFVAGILAGLLFTKNRRYLTNWWLWSGVLLAFLIILPNIIWQVQHHFISLAFLGSIHTRDLQQGRNVSFLFDQIKFYFNPVSIGLILAGLYFCWFNKPNSDRYRMLGWMYLIPLLLLLGMKGNGYYLNPAYPMLLAAGVVWLEQWLLKRPERSVRRMKVWIQTTLIIFAVGMIAVTLPVAPVNSAWWRVLSSINGQLKEEIGWPELMESVAHIYAKLPASEKQVTGILAGSGGSAGAFNLLGPAYGLPHAISGFNSFWERGYGYPPPQTLIVVDVPVDFLKSNFEFCEIAGYITNRYGIENEETGHHVIYICRGLRRPWPEFWKNFHYFG